MIEAARQQNFSRVLGKGVIGMGDEPASVHR